MTAPSPAVVMREGPAFALSDEGAAILDGRYGTYAALLLMTQTLEAFADNSLTPTGKKMAAKGAVMGRRALARPHMRKLARELKVAAGDAGDPLVGEVFGGERR